MMTSLRLRQRSTQGQYLEKADPAEEGEAAHREAERDRSGQRPICQGRAHAAVCLQSPHGLRQAWIVVTPGNVHDNVAFDEVCDRVTAAFPEAVTIVADSAYSMPHMPPSSPNF